MYGVKLAFHDTDSESPDTSIHPYVRYVRFPREDPHGEVRVGVGVGAVECQLNGRAFARDPKSRGFECLPVRFQVIALGKLLTARMSLCHQAV